MSRTASPLRYPGGKSCLYELTSRILRMNKLDYGHYAEPYAGGGGLALSLLYGGVISEIHLNDLDRSIWAFWHCVLNHTEEFIDLVSSAPVTLDEWFRHKSIYDSPDAHDDLTLGFSTFFLNRTNRSGIIKGGGVIGGFSQKGEYKIDCRFNRKDLARRIGRIAKYKSQIHLYGLDALEFMKQADKNLPARSFFCIDPPYFNKGSSLYTNFYNPEDHAAVSQAILSLQHPWILTYDYTSEISSLYKKRRQYSFDVNYSVYTKRVGTELMVVSKGLKMPEEVRERQVYRPQYRAA